MKMLRLPMMAAAIAGALVMPDEWSGAYGHDRWAGPHRGRLKPLKKRNHNTAKQAAAKQARKITRRRRP